MTDVEFVALLPVFSRLSLSETQKIFLIFGAFSFCKGTTDLQPPTAAEYAERRREIQEFREKHYTQVNMSSKVDVLIDDVEKIMAAGPDDLECAFPSRSGLHMLML